MLRGAAKTNVFKCIWFPVGVKAAPLFLPRSREQCIYLPETTLSLGHTHRVHKAPG